jgi:hypothetical protein
MKRIQPITILAILLYVMPAFAEPADPSLYLRLPLDEGTGYVATDRSVNPLEAELSNIQWVKGAFGTAVHLTGTNSFIDLPRIPGLNGATQFTLSVWVTWEGTGRYPNIITTRTWSPGGFMIFVSDNSCSYRAGRPGQRAGVPGNSWSETGVAMLESLPMRKWTHLCVVFAMPDITTWVNGKKVSAGKWNYPLEADELRIGSWSGSVSHTGLIDDVRIYGRALKEQEISELAGDPLRSSSDYAILNSSMDVRPAVIFENRYARMVIDQQGRISSLINTVNKHELLGQPQSLVSARLKDGGQLTARRVTMKGNELTFDFPRGTGKVVLTVDKHKDFFTFTVRSLTVPGVESLTFADIPIMTSKYHGGMANMLSDDTDAVCLRGYELPVEMEIGGNPPRLRVRTTAKYGLTGWRAGLAAGPKKDMPAMLRAMAEDAGAPSSKLGGPWSLGAEANRGSYLFADMSHASTDDWIDLARRGGFSCIHIHGWWRNLGHYGVNTNLFPREIEDLKDTVARIHDAGLRAGIHTLTACIDTRDSWITPEASPHLIAFDTYTLTRPMSPTDTVMYVQEKPSDRHDVVFTYAGNGNAIRVGSEIIQYSEISREPPYAFLKCQRGGFKTRPAAHAAGEHASYLQQRYMAFYPEPDSPLAGELADCIARVYNTCRLDQIYFDGSEGMMSRYGIDAMRHAIFKRLHGEVLAEASCHGQHNWWFHSRLGAWDHPVWAPKRFQDKHIEVSAKYRMTDLLEPQMGWWAPRGPSAQARGHFIDDMEYFAAKNMGLDSAMSIQGINVSRRPLPLYIENQITLLGWYEHLRLARYFDTQTVARVAVPGDEFRLRQNSDGLWQFTPVRMESHRISALGNGSERWTGHNTFAEQRLAARIEALYSVAQYDSDKRICVTDFADLKSYKQNTASSAVSLQLAEETTDTKGGPRNLRLTAANKGATCNGAWTAATLSFPAPYKNLGGTAAFGVWVKGDGKGTLLNIQFGTPREYMHATSDHYVMLDFTGWRYVELLVRERDVEQMSNYSWPYGGSYDIHRNPLDMSHISQVAFYLNNIPAGNSTDVVIGPVMALPTQTAELKNPVLAVNGQTLAIPCTLKSGDFLEVDASGTCSHHADNGDVIELMKPAGNWPVIRAGNNALTFGWDKPQGVSARAEVTVNTFGTPFGTQNPRGRIGWKHLTREYEMTRLVLSSAADDNSWDVIVRPGGKARLEIELCGVMENPALTVCGQSLRFPVTLKSGQRLACTDGRKWSVIDADRRKISEGQLSEAVPMLKGGINRVCFSCSAADRAQVKLVKVYD